MMPIRLRSGAISWRSCISKCYVFDVAREGFTPAFAPGAGAHAGAIKLLD